MSLAAIGREIRFRDCSTICQSRRTEEDIEQAAIEGAVHRLRPKLMTVTAVLASLVPILWETGIGSDVMKPICGTRRRRHDYFDHSRFDLGPSIFCHDEGTGAAPRRLEATWLVVAIFSARPFFAGAR